ncbi:MAG TPA: ATP-binding protein [Luteolibacter sp.]|nr:ATP-binding protein [Luteolibacter sp.]
MPQLSSPLLFAPIPRTAAEAARKRLAGFPILAITGPRQSGKTTLSRLIAPDLPYFSLEDPDTRALATEDPRAFLRHASDGAILDEVQRAPGLFSYLQGVVDADHRMGRFILTGSSQFEVIESITQSLAGRVSLLTLLPFSLAELQAAGRAPASVDALLHAGLFPPIHDRPVDPTLWLQDYISTYLERDVRQILNIQDLATFQRFIQLCAGRIGQLLNVSSLAADTGITRITAESWLSVLQASHLVFLVRPWFHNLNKRLIKTPKLYFCDPGLAAWFLGVRDAAHITAHPQRGHLFENWAMTELLKAQTHRGIKPTLHFLRDKEGHEIDALIETGPDTFQAVEIKSGETVAADFFSGLDYWRSKLTKQSLTPWLIHGGTARQDREKATVLPWNNLSPLLGHLG